MGLGGLGGNEPIRQREFDLYKESTDRRLEWLERAFERLDQEHDTDMDGLAKAAEERRKAKRGDRQWTFGQVVGVISALAALGTLWLAVIAR